MKKLFLTAVFAFITVFSYGQTFIFKGLVSSEEDLIPINKIIKNPDVYGIPVKELNKIRNWTIKLIDKDGGLEILSTNYEDSPINKGMFFNEDSEKDNYYIYEESNKKYDITLETTFGYYNSFTLGIYKDKGLLWFNDMKKQDFDLLFDRK